MMTDINEILRLFCGEYPGEVRTPWSFGKFTYASDGFKLVRVPRVSDVPERDDAPDTEVLRTAFEREPEKWLGLDHIMGIAEEVRDDSKTGAFTD